MADLDLPPDVRDLVNRHLPSLDHVEVLLRLRDAPDTSWSLDDLDRITRFATATTRRCLADLERAGLIRRNATDGRFQYAPHTIRDRATVDSLAVVYSERPVTLVHAIYARPARNVQTFTDAFGTRDPKER